MAAAIRVLLVEPHADTLELYSFELTGMGWQVIPVTDGGSAARAFASNPPDVVVSAAHLPGEDALALMRAFGEAGVPVIALTTVPPAQHHIYSELRLAALLAKPCLPERLAQAIRHTLRLAAMDNG